MIKLRKPISNNQQIGLTTEGGSLASLLTFAFEKVVLFNLWLIVSEDLELVVLLVMLTGDDVSGTKTSKLPTGVHLA